MLRCLLLLLISGAYAEGDDVETDILPGVIAEKVAIENNDEEEELLNWARQHKEELARLEEERGYEACKKESELGLESSKISYKSGGWEYGQIHGAQVSSAVECHQLCESWKGDGPEDAFDGRPCLNWSFNCRTKDCLLANGGSHVELPHKWSFVGQSTHAEPHISARRLAADRVRQEQLAEARRLKMAYDQSKKVEV
jgi:hypothetical protein